ncbi:unnamed protein product, partial [marine sediment metagenome]
DGPFLGVPEKYKGYVLYFDPPWLEGIKGHESTKDDYVLHGITVGGKTLEQWITESPGAAMTVMRVPPGYRLDPIPGYRIESQLLKNSLVIFVIPNTPVVQSPSVVQTKITKTTITQPATAQTTTTQTQLPPGVRNDEIEWYNGLRDFLRETLKMIIPSGPHIEKMVSDEGMAVWVNCFTHESYNPNIGMNYEELEMVGDHAMEYNFIMYMYLTIPNIT